MKIFTFILLNLFLCSRVQTNELICPQHFWDKAKTKLKGRKATEEEWMKFLELAEKDKQVEIITIVQKKLLKAQAKTAQNDTAQNCPYVKPDKALQDILEAMGNMIKKNQTPHQ